MAKSRRLVLISQSVSIRFDEICFAAQPDFLERRLRCVSVVQDTRWYHDLGCLREGWKHPSQIDVF